MFIKNCPSKELTKWTVMEFQDLLDEYHTGRSSRGAASAVSRRPSENMYVNKIKMLHTAIPPPDSKELPDLADL